MYGGGIFFFYVRRLLRTKYFPRPVTRVRTRVRAVVTIPLRRIFFISLRVVFEKRNNIIIPLVADRSRETHFVSDRLRVTRSRCRDEESSTMSFKISLYDTENNSRRPEKKNTFVLENNESIH